MARRLNPRDYLRSPWDDVSTRSERAESGVEKRTTIRAAEVTPSTPQKSEARTRPKPQPAPAKRAKGRPLAAGKANVNIEDLALALLLDKSEPTLAEIARRLGVSRTSLYRLKRFRENAAKVGRFKPRPKKSDKPGVLPSGYKADGTVEAIDE